MYEEIIPYEKFQELDQEKQREILIKYQDKFSVDEICEAWGLNQYHYYKIVKELDLPPRKKKLFKKTKQKSGEQTSETSEKTMTPIQNALSINLDGTYQAEEVAKYLEKLAFLLADMEEKEVKIKLNIEHKL